MANLKGSSDLTRGRSLTDANRLILTLSRPAVLPINMKMKEMSGVRFWSSEKYIDIKQTRLSRLQSNANDMGQ